MDHVRAQDGRCWSAFIGAGPDTRGTIHQFEPRHTPALAPAAIVRAAFKDARKRGFLASIVGDKLYVMDPS